MLLQLLFERVERTKWIRHAHSTRSHGVQKVKNINREESDKSDESGHPAATTRRTSRTGRRTLRATRLAASDESNESGHLGGDDASEESDTVGATGGDPRVGRVDESNTQPPRRTLLSDSVGATRRAAVEKGESTVALCRSDTSTRRYDSTIHESDDV